MTVRGETPCLHKFHFSGDTMKIIYPQASGEIAILMPMTDTMPLAELARKDVPHGAPFLILQDEQLPADWSFSAAWTADFSNPDGYGIGAQRWFIERAEKEIAQGKDVEQNQRLIQQMKDEIFQIEGVRL